MQFPVHVAIPPASHMTVHGIAAPVQSRWHVEPTSQMTVQPPPEHARLHIDELSQSDVQLPPEHV